MIKSTTSPINKKTVVISVVILSVIFVIILVFTHYNSRQMTIKPLAESSDNETTENIDLHKINQAMNSYKTTSPNTWGGSRVSAAKELYREGEFAVFSLTQTSLTNSSNEITGYAILKGDTFLVAPNSDIMGADLHKDMGVPVRVVEAFNKARRDTF